MTTIKISTGVEPEPPAWLTTLLAIAGGLVLANLYYAQPLIGLIAISLKLPPQWTGLIVTLTQIGYGAGLLLIVPLGDLVENRRLMVSQLVLLMLALLLAASASDAATFLVAAGLIGLGAVVVQIILPYVAHLAPERIRGRVVGNVVSGLMLGIMLSRPTASFLAYLLSWHTVFLLSAGVIALLALVLWRWLPDYQPEANTRYPALLLSLGSLWLMTPMPRRRAIAHACLFATFSLFWTVTPLLLASPAYGLSQSGIALFALVGVAGALSAPFGGRLADRGQSHIASVVAMLIVAVAFVITHLAAPGSGVALGLLALAGVLLDGAVTVNAVLVQRAIFVCDATLRSRLNGLYSDFLYWRRNRFCDWRLDLRTWRLAASLGHRAGIAATSAVLFYGWQP